MNRSLSLLLACGALLAGCATFTDGPAATAQLAPTAGNTVSGTVRFVQHRERVKVSGEVRGLRPNAEHGFHVHEKGDCSAPDATSAGGHFNPGSQPHGPRGGPHHAGDLPNLHADAAGVARFSFEASGLGVGSGNDISGKGLVVHRDPDDFASQPAGNSGPRLACAVITRS